jgi:hypothetical protein
MTLSSQKTSILILAPGYNTSLVGDNLNMIVCNDGSQAFFSPFGFPIHGEYDDYGYIDNIKRDKNVEMIEEYFGLDIDSILQNIGRGVPENIKNEEFYKTLGLTYFRTEVLEYLERGWDEYNLIDPQEYSSESYIKKILDRIKKNITNEKITDLIDKKIKGDLSEDEMDLYFEYVIKLDSFKSYIATGVKCNMFRELPITIDFKDEILKQYTMLKNLGFGLKKNLTPSNYGSQEDNWVELYKFNDFVSDILVQDIKERNDRWGDEISGEEKEVINLHKAVKRHRKINSIIKND